MESFQKAFYKQQNTNPTQRIYSPEEMKLFTDVHSPGLFQMMLDCISRNKNLKDKRKELQEQRVVSLLHIIAYFRYIFAMKLG